MDKKQFRKNGYAFDGSGTANNHVISSFWQGPMSLIQQLSMRSYICAGHCLHLYMYDPPDPDHLPGGVVVKNAADILPRDRIFTYRRGAGKGSIAAFSNLFRYTLLYKQGGWWTDLDVICLKHFDFEDDYVFCAQRNRRRHLMFFTRQTDNHANNNIIKCPPGSAVMRYCIDRIENMDLGKVCWGEIGPGLMQAAIAATTGMTGFLKPYTVFNPVDWFDVKVLFKPANLPGDTYAVHLYEEMWRRSGIDPGASFAPDCLYETLKERFL